MAKTSEKEMIRTETADASVEVIGAPASATGSGGKTAGKARSETAYTISELAANAVKIFGTRPECVTAALRSVGDAKTFTVAEAKEIVSRFLNREVK